MGFKTRERQRRRRKRIASSAAQIQARKTGSSKGGWWLTPVQSTTCCAKCATILRVGADMVYRHVPREARCMRCAERNPESKGYRTSLRWERTRYPAHKAKAAGLGGVVRPEPVRLVGVALGVAHATASSDSRTGR